MLEHTRFLRVLARSLVTDPHRAEDLVQDTWLTALERPPEDRGTMRAWLARVLQNRAYNVLSRERARPAREDVAEQERPARSAGPVEVQLDLQATIVRALKELREPYRSTLYQRYYLERGPIEIARHDGVPVKTVKTRLRRGLDSLRERLDREHGGDRSAWCALLLPFAFPEGLPTAPPVAATSAPTVTGGSLAGWTLFGLVAGTGIVAAVLWRHDPHPESLHAGTPPFTIVDSPEAELSAGLAAGEDARRALGTGPFEADVLARVDAGAIGRVVDYQGNPIAGAEVLLLERPSFARKWSERSAPVVDPLQAKEAVRTNERGEYALPGDDRLRWLDVRADGFAPRSVRSELPAGEIRLDRGVLLDGRVVDEFGEPAAGAIVLQRRVDGRPGPTWRGQRFEPIAISDEGGSFEVASQAVGPWRLRAELDDLAGESAGTTERPAERVEGIEIVLAPRDRSFAYESQGEREESRRGRGPDEARAGTGELRLVVHERETGRPLAGAQIEVVSTPDGPAQDIESDDRVGRTDAEGRFRLAELSGQRALVLVRAPGFASVTQVLALDATEHALSLERAASLSVLLRVDGFPVAGADVSLRDPRGVEPRRESRWTESSGSRVGATDSTGRFAWEDLAPGAYEVSVRHPRLDSAFTVEVELYSGRNDQVLDVPTAGVFGVVTDEEGRPRTGVRVVVESGDTEPWLDDRTTGLDGGFELAVVAERPFSLRVVGGAGGAGARTQEWTLAPGEVLEGVVLRTEAEARLTVSLADEPDGGPWFVRVRQGEDRRVASLRAGESVTLSGLSAGSAEVELFAPGRSRGRRALRTETVKLIAGVTAETLLSVEEGR